MQLKDNRLLKMRKCCIIYLPIILMPVKLRVNSLLKMFSSSQHTRYKDQLQGQDPAHQFYLKCIKSISDSKTSEGNQINPQK